MALQSQTQLYQIKDWQIGMFVIKGVEQRALHLL
jgi:hypothetical protein